VLECSNAKRRELSALQAQNEALQQQLAAERQTARATERRLREHLQSLLEQRNGVGAEPEPAMVLPPPTHPFWRQDDGPAQAIRMLADSESGRTRAAAQLEAALEARRALASQLESLREHCRSLQSTVLSLELRAGRL